MGVAAAFAVAASPAAGAAQIPPAATRGLDAGYRATARSAHARGTVVAMALRMGTGSSADPSGLEGTAALLGQVLGDQARRALGPHVATVTATVDRGTTTFTLLVLPEAWPGAAEVVDSVVFDAPLDHALIERDRRAQLARLTFESGSPGASFQVEAARLLAGPDSAWGRPIRGTVKSLAAVDASALEAYRNAHYRRDTAVRAVVGPRPVISVIAPTRPDSVGVAADTTARPAWTTGSRAVEVRDVTSTWIRVAYPISPSTPRIAAEMLADLVNTELNPTPPDPDRYGVDVSLRRAPGGSVLVVDAIVFPEAADRWESRIIGDIRALAAKPMEADFFSWRRRRFRTERLLEEAAPEAEARRMADDLLRDGRARDLGVEIWSLDAEAVQRAALGLGQPRILRFGPQLGQTRTGGGRTGAPPPTRAERRPTPYIGGSCIFAGPCDDS